MGSTVAPDSFGNSAKAWMQQTRTDGASTPEKVKQPNTEAPSRRQTLLVASVSGKRRGPFMPMIAYDAGLLHGPPNSVLAAKRSLEDGATKLNVDLALTKDD